MGKIQLVVEIDEKAYEQIKRIELGPGLWPTTLALYNSVQNGTPLPKGHGDLIDRRELKKEVYTTTEWNGDIHRIIYEASIDDAKPIIEKDGD